jgi:hypothetical protein
MAIEDLSDEISQMQIKFRILSSITGDRWNWEHPRVLAWMQRCGFSSRYDLGRQHYQTLLRRMDEVERSEILRLSSR